MPPPAGALLLRSPLYSHSLTPASRPLVCAECLARPGLWDHLPPGPPLQRCARCKLPHYCGPACQRAAWRAGHQAECRVLQRVAPRVPPPLVLLLLRTMARRAREGPEGAREQLPGGAARGLRDLMAHQERVGEEGERREAFMAFLPVIAACVGETYSRSDLWDTYCRIVINATEMTDAMGNSIGTCLSLGLSALDHSCAPNCQVAFVGAAVEVRALPGTEVAWEDARVTYLPPCLPAAERRARLERQYYFRCTCVRCTAGGLQEELLAGAAVCPGCRVAVAVVEGRCGGCGAEVPAEARVAGAFLQGEEGSLQRWRRLGATFHALDWRMVELGEAATADALDAGKFSTFLEVGEQLLAAYRAHLHPYSASLGLHLAMLAKAAIFLERQQEGIDYLREAVEVLGLALGPDSALVSYCQALRSTV